MNRQDRERKQGSRSAFQIRKVVSAPEVGVVIAIAVIIIVFSLLSDKFLTLASFSVMLVRTAELGIVAIGIAFLMISGEFDLSASSVFALVPIIMALLMREVGLDPVVASLIALSLACLIGFINGKITVKLELPSFITTLGMMMFLRGSILAITGGFLLHFEGGELFRQIMAGPIWGFLRVSAIWAILICLLFTVILIRKPYGNWVFAVGGNKKAAQMLGIPVARVKMINFIVCSLLAGIAGLISFARIGMVAPTTGVGMELEAIASAVIGGCLLAGGFGSIVGAFMGAFIIAMIHHGLILIGAPPFWYTAFVGLLLIIAAIINTTIRRKTK